MFNGCSNLENGEWKMEKCHDTSGRGEPANYLGRGDVTGGLPNQKWDPEALLRKNL